MPSREVRRTLNKKDKPEEQPEDVRFKGRPILYALSVATLVIIVITFIGAPVVSRWAYGERFVFGTYAGKDIAFIPGYENYFEQQYRYWGQQFSQYNFANGDVKQQMEYIFRYAYENTLQHVAVLAQAEKSGVQVSNSAVDESLLEYGPYVEGATFSKERFDATPPMNRNAIKKTRAEDLLAQKYVSDMLAVNNNVENKNEQDFILNTLGKERQFAVVNFEFDKFPPEQIKQYAQSNLEKFKKIQLSRIIIKSNKNEAESIRDMAVRGERSFDDLARTFSKDELYAEKGGEMGWQNYYELKLLLESDDAVRGIFKTAKGSYSNVIEIKNELGGEKSWIFYRVDSDPVNPELEKEETLNTIKSYLLANEKSVMDNYFMDKAKEFKTLAIQKGDKGFADAAKTLNLNAPQETDFFPINYNNVFQDKGIKQKGKSDPSILTAAVGNEDVLKTLFTLKTGDITDPVLINNQILVVKMLGERDIPEADKTTLAGKLGPWAQQSVQRDMTSQGIDEKLKKDNFQAAFQKFVAWRFKAGGAAE